MGLSLKTRIFLLLVVTVMTVGWSPRPSTTHAAEAEQASYHRDELDASLQLPAVSIDEHSFIELRSASVMPSEKGRTLFFTVTVSNGESQSISFLDYWVKVYSRGGTEFKPELLPQDKLKKEIPAGQRVDYSFYAPVNDSLEELLFRVTRWDYSTSELEQPIGDIPFPEDAAEASRLMTAVASSRIVPTDAGSLQLEVTKWSASVNDNYTTPKLTLRLTNKGRVSLRISAYQYSLRAGNGAIYPLQIAASNIMSTDKELLQPDMPVELQLRTEPLPASAGNGIWDVIMTQSIPLSDDSKLNYPVTTLRVPSEKTDTLQLGSTVEYANEDGVYLVTPEKLERLPWEDQDILSTELAVSHRHTEALPLPDMKAYYELDGGVKVEAQVIRTDRAVGVPPGGTVHVQIVGKIPYTYPFAASKLLLEEKISENATEDMAQFLLPPSDIRLPSVALGQQQSIVGAGRSTVYSPREVNTYTDGKSRILETQLEIVNWEKRSNAIPKLTAFYKTPDDALYPTQIREIKQKLNPQGRALLSFSAKLPQELESKDLKLVIGESVTGQRLSGTEDKPDAYIHAVEMELPRERTEVQPTLKNMTFYPYTLSIGQISTWLDAKQLRISYQYKLSKDSYFETSHEGSRIVVQFEDVNGTAKFEETFYLESAPEDEDKRLELGEHDYKMIRQDADLLYQIYSLKQFKLNIYHEFQGKRKLLASQTMDWFGKME